MIRSPEEISDGSGRPRDWRWVAREAGAIVVGGRLGRRARDCWWMAREAGELAIGVGCLARSASSRLEVGGPRGRCDWWWVGREAGEVAIGGGWLVRSASSRLTVGGPRGRRARDRRWVARDRRCRAQEPGPVDGDDGDGTETRRQ